MIADHSLAQQQMPEVNAPQIDFGSGFTSSQIAQMRAEKEKQIKDIQFQIKMAEADYAIKKTEMETGEVVAKIDGTVVSLLKASSAAADSICRVLSANWRRTIWCLVRKSPSMTGIPAWCIPARWRVTPARAWAS